jgi:hypothetical protein
LIEERSSGRDDTEEGGEGERLDANAEDAEGIIVAILGV